MSTTSVTIPFDACICEGQVSRPRSNCWATSHDLNQRGQRLLREQADQSERQADAYRTILNTISVLQIDEGTKDLEIRRLTEQEAEFRADAAHIRSYL